MEQIRNYLGRTSAVICCMVLLCLGFAACSSNDDPVVNQFKPDSPTEERIDTARYTIIVYGNAGGYADLAIEQVFENTKPLLKLGDDVRLIFAYKYGMDNETHDYFTGKYADPGMVVYFEMHDGLDLNRLRENSGVYPDFPMFDTGQLTYMLNDVARNAPARDYIFVLWGHGSGYNPMFDVPWNLKLPAEASATTRGVIHDEWLHQDAMDMYEFSRAIEDSDIGRFKAIFFHNCMLGNMETLTEIQPCAEYLMSSSHLLYSGGKTVVNLVRHLHEDNFEEAARKLFTDDYEEWKSAYPDGLNGDMNMVRAEGLTDVNAQIRRLVNWLCRNYPTKKEAIDRATNRVYRFVQDNYDDFYDAADYADKLAEETGDADVKEISQSLRAAFNRAFVHRIKTDSPAKTSLPEYTLSTVIVHKNIYLYEQPLQGADYSYGLIYSGTTYHQLTGWGNWLSMNEQMPEGNPYGQPK